MMRATCLRLGVGTLLAVLLAVLADAQTGGPLSAQIQRAFLVKLGNSVYSTDPAVANFGMGGTTPYVFTGTAAAGHDNLFIGLNAGDQVTDGIGNMGIGHSALGSLTTGINNLAVGWDSQYVNSTGGGNVSLGEDALKFTLGNNNTGLGYTAGYTNSTGNSNTAVGEAALYSNSTGSNNTAVGLAALQDATGAANTGIGLDTIRNTTGSNNTALGFQAGRNTGALAYSNNVFLGSQAGYYETGSSTLMIDSLTRTNEADGRTKAMLYGVFGADSSTQRLDVNGRFRSTAGQAVGAKQFYPGGAIYHEFPNIANAADTNNVSSTAYSLPAGTAANNGDTIRIEAMFSLSAAVSSRTMQCNIGYSSYSAAAGFTGGAMVITYASTNPTTTVIAKATVRRQTATLTDYDSTAFYTATAAWQGSATYSAALTWTAANNILCAAKDGSSNAAAVTIKYVRVYWDPAP